MRKKFDYWGVPFSELFPNYHAPHTVECDCGERA
ncbi:TPA: DNA helicase UvrA, partial [Enterococcus faecium]|nr:DNA helicase UvrA [Enterococcus faecium]